MLASWIVTVNAQTTAEKQLELIAQAAYLMNDGIYIRAVTLLEEAAGYSDEFTLEAERKLKQAYLALIDNRGFGRRYTTLLERQINRHNHSPDMFEELANYYLSISRTAQALNVLKAGLERTGCQILIAMYEDSRYAFETSRSSYDYVSAIYNGTVRVRRDGLWGIANSQGTIIIPCAYDKISTFCTDRAVVKRDGEIFAVDRNNNRIALLRNGAEDFGNLANNRISIRVDGVWRRATGDFSLGSAEFEQIGMYADGYAAAKTGGRWGVIDLGMNWLVPPIYDGIIMDELGRCFGQGAVFVKSEGAVYLVVENQIVGVYEDARPFSNEGFAAVKNDGRWGFINTNGEVMIDFIFDDALSFGQHLAAVKIGELWGYISIGGAVVIDVQFIEAKSFSGGSAPVLTERGWSFITLLEYK